MLDREQMEKSFIASQKMVENYWNLWNLTMENITWSQKKAEEIMTNYIEQSKKIREEQSELLNIIATQAKKNQMQLKNIIEENMRIGQENLKSSTSLFKKFSNKSDS